MMKRGCGSGVVEVGVKMSDFSSINLVGVTKSAITVLKTVGWGRK